MASLLAWHFMFNDTPAETGITSSLFQLSYFMPHLLLIHNFLGEKNPNILQPNHCICVCMHAHIYIKISVFSQIWHKQIQKGTEYLISERICYQKVCWMWNTTNKLLRKRVKIIFKNWALERIASQSFTIQSNENNIQKRCFLLSLFTKQISRNFFTWIFF